MKRKLKVLRKRALRIRQNESRPLFLFSLNGKELLELAEVSRVSRDDADKLIGYQRPEVKRHIKEITDYLNCDDVLFPNSIILALSSGVRFVESRGPQIGDRNVSAGVLEIPIPRDGGVKPGWIVDGQQRAMAISRSKRQSLNVPVNGFLADDVEIQRDQFLRINNTKPLPRGLISELLPEVNTPLPQRLAVRQIPARLCELLNKDPNSPFKDLIKRPSSDNKSQAILADTAIIKMIEESMTSPSGCLHPYRNIATGETDIESMKILLLLYWTAVKNVFPQAWGRPPVHSRLMHSVGLRAMGRLMDKVMPFIPLNNNNVCIIEKEIRRIVPYCHWVSGRWEELGDLPWNELQNVPRHIRVLSNFLIRSYVQAKGVST